MVTTGTTERNGMISLDKQHGYRRMPYEFVKANGLVVSCLLLCLDVLPLFPPLLLVEMQTINNTVRGHIALALSERLAGLNKEAKLR